MEELSKEYLVLFRAVTEAEETLCALRERLIEAERLAEELYIGKN
jgi:hypothetical protein